MSQREVQVAGQALQDLPGVHVPPLAPGVHRAGREGQARIRYDEPRHRPCEVCPGLYTGDTLREDCVKRKQAGRDLGGTSRHRPLQTARSLKVHSLSSPPVPGLHEGRDHTFRESRSHLDGIGKPRADPGPDDESIHNNVEAGLPGRHRRTAPGRSPGRHRSGEPEENPGAPASGGCS